MILVLLSWPPHLKSWNWQRQKQLCFFKYTTCLFLSFVSLTLLKNIGWVFCRCPAIWVSLVLCHDCTGVMGFGERILWKWNVLIVSHHRGHHSHALLLVTSTFISGLRLSSRFLHCKITIALFILLSLEASHRIQLIFKRRGITGKPNS